VLLAATPSDQENGWIKGLRQAAPGILLEGRLGSLVTLVAPAKTAVALAAWPGVVAVRLPRTAQSSPSVADDSAKAVRSAVVDSGLARLHESGFQGRGTRIAVIDADFRGWEAEKGRGLPADVSLIDLTAERNRSLTPDPSPAGAGVSHGVRAASAAAAAAPKAKLVLIRVDPAAPYQILTVLKALSGSAFRTLALEQRSTEIEEERNALEGRRIALEEERRQVFADLRQDDEVLKRKADYEKQQADFDRDVRAFDARVRRLLALERDLTGLKDVRVATSSLVWEEGQPTGGAGSLSRYFDDQPHGGALWLQSAGDAAGAVWNELFRDSDHNGVMEFASDEQPLAGDRWTRELNFLSWRSRGSETLDLPAGARIRVTVQWREPHDPIFLRAGEDAFREPLTQLRLFVLRQTDPLGKKQPADDFQVVTQSSGLAQRLDNEANAATYEESVEFVVAAAGRYALRIEGKTPKSDRPANAPSLPALLRVGEIHPRVVLTTLKGDGRAVFHDYAGFAGSVGVPADARRTTAVAGGDAVVDPTWWSPKPDVRAPKGFADADGGVAAAFAAGFATVVREAGAPPSAWSETLRIKPGGVLRVPEGWPRP
jgi:hypothetical protein